MSLPVFISWALTILSFFVSGWGHFVQQRPDNGPTRDMISKGATVVGPILTVLSAAIAIALGMAPPP